MNLIAVSQDSNELMRLEKICREIKSVIYQQSFNDPIDALEHMDSVDLVVIDTDIQGGAACLGQKIRDLDEDINIVFMSAEKSFAMDAFSVDAIDYCLKPCTKRGVLRFIQRAKEWDSVILSHFTIPDMIQPITDIDDFYSQLPEDLRQRSERIAEYTAILMRHTLNAGVYTNDVDLSVESYTNIIEIVKPHDIGMACIPPGITGATKKDRLHLQKHTEYGMLLLANHVFYAFGSTKDITLASTKGTNKISLYYLAMTTARSHHERWDGKGFPDGLEGESIPVIARMYAICSFYLVLVEDYALSCDAIYAEMKKNAGSLFDPVLV